MGAADMHRESQVHAALRACELSMTEAEQADVRRRMYAMGWNGRTTVFTGVMAQILGDVAPMKLDKAYRDRLLIGHFEDVQ